MRDVEDARRIREWCSSHDYWPRLRIGLVVPDPADPPVEALEAQRCIEELGANVFYVERGTHYLIFFGWGTLPEEDDD